jgi:hypothetical protein
MRVSIKPSWHRTESGSRDGVTVTFRAGGASLCTTVLRPAVGDEVMRGASVLEYLRSRGATVTVCPASRFGVAVAGSLDPADYIEGWRWRRDPKNVANARETSFWFSREMLAWRWRVEPRKRSEFVRNTKRDGFATWSRVILGEMTTREVASYERPVIVSLPEGDYKATARVVVDEELRSRVPEWLRKIAPKFVRRVRITTEQPVRAPGWTFGYTTSHAEAGDDVDGAALRFAESVEKQRAAHPEWSLPLKMRAVAGEVDTWDAFHYASGEWRRWGVSKREALPKEAVVESDAPAAGSSATLATIVAGSLFSMVGVVGYGLFRREAAMAGRL